MIFYYYLDLLEALSCSLPVITTYNTGGVDIIDHGKNGFLTPVRDTKKTIEILHNLYHNEEFRRSIAENAFANVNNNWCIDNWCSMGRCMFCFTLV